MSAETVVFMDSGVGGLPYFRHFIEHNPHSAVWYIADRENFPYGQKTKAELIEILIRLVGAVAQKIEDPLVVLACNTASVSALDELRRCFPALRFVGTVPAVRPAVLHSAAGKIGVLGTERTVSDHYIAALVHKAEHSAGITAIAAPELVNFIENDFLDADSGSRLAAAERWTACFRNSGVDAIVLGCTHFLFLRDEFKKAAAPDMTIYDSLEGVCRQTESLLRTTDGSSLCKFLVTGSAPLEDKWPRWARLFNTSAALFKEQP